MVNTCFLRRLGIVLALLSGLATARAECLTGRVVRISDGDTLTLLTLQRQEIRVRLAEIDAPERGQAFGRRSKESLSEMTFNKAVCVEPQGTDRYGRMLGRIYVGTLNVNAEQIKRGMAWVYRRYSHDPGLVALEAQAQAAKMGLWSDSQPQPPWEYRAGTPHVQAGAAVPTACGHKRYCREMADCAEALFYFQQCGVHRLDGDGDGVPCEKLCRKMM